MEVVSSSFQTNSLFLHHQAPNPQVLLGIRREQKWRNRDPANNKRYRLKVGTGFIKHTRCTLICISSSSSKPWTREPSQVSLPGLPPQLLFLYIKFYQLAPNKTKKRARCYIQPKIALLIALQFVDRRVALLLRPSSIVDVVLLRLWRIPTGRRHAQAALSRLVLADRDRVRAARRQPGRGRVSRRHR